MIKKIFVLLVLMVTAVYLGFAVTVLNVEPSKTAFGGIVVVFDDEVDYGLVSQADIEKLMKRKEVHPEGKPSDEINVRAIEDTLATHPFIKDVDCYITPAGKLIVHLSQRIPLIRVMNVSGEDYYVDSEGKIMASSGKPVHVVVATGYIDKEFAQTSLYEFAKFIHHDKFWEAQIEQVNVTSKKELELTPRVGNHVVFLGKPGDYNEKFAKLRTFYEKGLNEVGWNKYDRISIEFTNQIICTKKDK